jgi:hypothetical protein
VKGLTAKRMYGIQWNIEDAEKENRRLRCGREKGEQTWGLC